MRSPSIVVALLLLNPIALAQGGNAPAGAAPQVAPPAEARDMAPPPDAGIEGKIGRAHV